MNLYVTVREGDRAVLDYAPCGALVSGQLDRLIETGKFSPADGLERWRHLDAYVCQTTFEISVSDTGTMSVEDLKNRCLDEARRTGAARPETPPASPAAGTSGFTVISWETCGWITDVWLSDPVTDERISEHLAVNQTELADGDLIVLSIRHKPDGLYLILPSPNPDTLLRWLQLAENSAAAEAGPRLWGVLLYTDADVELATYVRTYFDDLNVLSGPATRIFVVERRTNWPTAKKYWRHHLEPELYRMMSAMHWLHWTPYDPQGAYEIADLLGIDPKLLPCLVFFHSPQRSLHKGEKIVFHIEHTSTAYFRSLFGGINSVLRPVSASDQSPQAREYPRRPELYGGPTSSFYEYGAAPTEARRYAEAPRALQNLLNHRQTSDAAAFAAVRAAEQTIKAGLQQIVASASANNNIVIVSGSTEAEVSENFHFHGENTTFINRPQDTIIQDFQNTHSMNPGIDDLTRLLQLVLSSRDLTDQDREELAQNIRGLARLDTSHHPDFPGAKTHLERLRSLLVTCADIAQPALEIIASLMRLFGA
jgi:hypothetical protein